MMQCMRARQLTHHKELRNDGSIVEIVMWLLDRPLSPCWRQYKYRLYFGTPDGTCRVRYDNELGKGDHRHLAGQEEAYEFVSIDKLLADFEAQVEVWT